ncbi:unnamed protein product [Lactuca saligna]|uniref:HAT C-terminal dimerisation domain-containing protein n=1 Tax=Lactuca saligna TaxID=75948 RepID=A0AA36DX23_LACSI|nr:unnamed protein product [Lactuca saligna]
MKVVFTQMLKAKNKDKKMFADEIESKARAKVIDIECKLDKFFKTYLERSNMTSSSQQETPEEVVNFDDENEFFGSYMTSGSFPSTLSESQLQRYLNEDPIGFDKGYDILTWWKNNAVRFTIVARMARDILGMQISTVASESTFSNGRRVITDYRTNLSVVIVEALICTQDWLRKSSLPIYDYDEVHDVLADDDLAIDIVDAIHNLKLTGEEIGKLVKISKKCWNPHIRLCFFFPVPNSKNRQKPDPEPEPVEPPGRFGSSFWPNPVRFGPVMAGSVLLLIPSGDKIATNQIEMQTLKDQVGKDFILCRVDHISLHHKLEDHERKLKVIALVMGGVMVAMLGMMMVGPRSL